MAEMAVAIDVSVGGRARYYRGWFPMSLGSRGMSIYCPPTSIFKVMIFLCLCNRVPPRLHPSDLNTLLWLRLWYAM